MKGVKKFVPFTSVLVALAVALFFVVPATAMDLNSGLFGGGNGASSSGRAKYVFFFIGDGMASVQIHAAEAYLASLNVDDTVEGGIKAVNLAVSNFPVQGMATTYAGNQFITDSAAAGTALACGVKTGVGVISMSYDADVSYQTVAELAKAQGKKVGIVSSVSIDHATPAVFYAHQASRNNYHEIAHQLATSGFDYFGGGGIKRPDGDLGNVYDAITANGYQIVTTRQELNAAQPGQKLVAYNHILDSSDALYYEMDRPADHISLAEFTAKGIELLDNSNGFFMMVEGGKIDWACHANDGKASIMDTIEFDKAVLEALSFYNQHPNETLIVVTGDHETGGMTIGFAGTQYATAFEVLGYQTKSFESFDKDLDTYKATAAWSGEADDMDATIKAMVLESFGLNYDDLSDFQKKQLEDAFDRSMKGEAIKSAEEDYLLYGGYEPFSVTLTHLLNQIAGLGWTSYAHTGVPVPVLAKGAASDLFNGFYDNTDVAKRIAQAMGGALNN